jgi:hypothetical protein
MFWADNFISGNSVAGAYDSYAPLSIDFRIFANWDAYEGGDGNLIYYNTHQFIMSTFRYFVNVPYSTAPSNPNLVINSFVYNAVGGYSRLTFTGIAPLLIRSHWDSCCDIYYSYFDLHLYGIDLVRTGGALCNARVISPANIYFNGANIPCGLIIGGDYPVWRITLDDRRNGINNDWNAGAAWTWEIDFIGYNWDDHDRNYVWMHLWAQNLPAYCSFCCCCCCWVEVVGMAG